MKVKILFAMIASVMIISCSNGDTSEENGDSANALTDTLPASSVGDTNALDSNPPDATHVDSMNNMSR
jgi:hypothetical protein